MTRLTTLGHVGKFVNNEGQTDLPLQGRSARGRHHRAGGPAGVFASGAQQSPVQVPGAAYSLNGVQVVGLDNERGKGDHCHIAGIERPYVFSSVEDSDD